MIPSKYGDLTNYKIPPQSTGGRVAHRRYIVAKIGGVDPNDDFPIGALYTLGNGTSGFVMEEHFSGSSNTRILILSIDRQIQSEFSTGNIIINGDTYTVESFQEILIPAITVTDSLNSNSQLAISRRGAASVTFTDGDPQLDNFGLLRIGSPSNIASYKFTDNFSLPEFINETAGTATIQRSIPNSSLVLDVGTTEGDSAIATTNNYHKYYTGFSTQILISSFCGDSGKTGVVRRWGFYDDEDGAYFELKDDTLYVVNRSSSSGTMIENRIEQTDFNRDILDGSETPRNRSGFNLKLENNNLFFINFSWLGSGSLQLGVYDQNGNRVVAHSFSQASNVSPNSFWKNPNLPLKFEVFNETATSSPSRFSLICGAVSTDALDTSDISNNDTVLSNFVMSEPKQISDSERENVMSLRMVPLLHGEKNRKKSVPTRITAHVKDGPIILEILFNTVLDNPNWQPVNPQSSSVEYDLEGELDNSQASLISHFFLDPGSHTIDVSEFFNTKSNYFNPNIDGSSSPTLTLSGRSLTTGETARVIYGANWVEL
jgi:hypothetical protein